MVLAFTITSSTPPTFKNACSGTSSRSPPTRASKQSHGLVDRDVDAWQAGEDLGHEERLGQEALDLPGPGHGQAVLFGQLVEAEDGDDVLELPVALQHLLDPAGALVVAVADDLGGEDVARRGERVDGRVDAEGGDVWRESSVVASRWVKVVNGAGSV